MSSALLALEDGSIWRGQSFGAPLTANGEVCFNTSMTGYQEILTDPSYRGQIVAMTYPLIGNTGINALDVESSRPHVAGLIVRELSPVVSSWRSEETLDSYLERHKIPGITGIDTRSLTLRLRTQGSLRGVLTSEKISDAAAVDLAKKWSYLERDFVKEVTCAKAYDWDPKSKLSRKWTLIQGKRPPGAPPLTGEDYLEKLPPVKYRIVAYDYGLKTNILRRLRQHGFQVRVLPATATADEALAGDPDGIFLSNGPGDPAVLRLRAQDGAVAHRQKADLRHLPGTPNPRLRAGRKDLQAQVRASRRQSTGQGPDHGPDQHHLAKPWLCGRSQVAAGG